MKSKKNYNKKKVFVIAEAGVAHFGSIKKAKKLVDLAHYSGADAVKFQAYVTKRKVQLACRTRTSLVRSCNYSQSVCMS